MQIPNTLQSLSDDEITALAVGARSHLADLERQHAEHAELHRVAAAAFKRDPRDYSARDTRDSEKQFSENAREEIAAFTASADLLRAEEARRSERRELEQLRSVVDISTKLHAGGSRIVELMATLDEALRTEIDAMLRAAHEHNQAAHRFNDLSRRHGDGAQVTTKITVENFFASNGLFEDQMTKRFGRMFRGSGHERNGARVNLFQVDPTTLVVSAELKAAFKPLSND